MKVPVSLMCALQREERAETSYHISILWVVRVVWWLQIQNAGTTINTEQLLRAVCRSTPLVPRG